MDLLSQTKYLLKTTGVRPSKAKGQNFCVDEKVIKEMADTAQISAGDAVLEAGPGFGVLTAELVKRAGKVMAVELDQKLAGFLINLQKLHKNLEVVQEDVLKFETSRLNDYQIVANLPYAITSAFLKKFLTAENKPRVMTLLLQKEVAERICAKAGQLNLLAISVQLYGQPRIVAKVPSSSFWPEPKIESAILKIDNIKDFPFADKILEKDFWRVVRSGFCAKRKQLKNNLANSLHLPIEKVSQTLLNVGLDLKVRAQEVAIDQWVAITEELLVATSKMIPKREIRRLEDKLPKIQPTTRK